MLDSEGRRFAFLEIAAAKSEGTLKIFKLPDEPESLEPIQPKKPSDSQSIPLNGLINQSGRPAFPPLVGLVDITPQDKADTTPRDKAFVVSPPVAGDINGFGLDHWANALSLGTGAWRNGSKTDPIQYAKELVPEFANAVFPPSIDFGAGGARVQIINWVGSSPTPVSYVPINFQLNSNSGLTLSTYGSTSANWRVNWRPGRQIAPRLPTLAPDCNKYAYLGAKPLNNGEDSGAPSQPVKAEPTMYLGNFAGGDSAPGDKPPTFKVDADMDLRQSVSVAYARGCGAIAMHYSTSQQPDLSRTQNEFFAIAEPNGSSWDDPKLITYAVPIDAQGFVQPSAPSSSPVLVASEPRQTVIFEQHGRLKPMGWRLWRPEATRHLPICSLKAKTSIIPRVRYSVSF